MLRYIPSALILLVAKVLIFATAWLIAIIPAIAKMSRLPGWLQYISTHDDDLYGSITTGEPIPATVFGRWKRIAWWLMRNPAYGIAAYVLGVPEDRVDSVTHSGYKAAGIHDTLHLKDGSTRWGYRRDLSYSKSRYIKMWFGWHWRPQKGAYMLKIEFNPFKSADS